MGVLIPNSRGQTKAWESASPTRGGAPLGTSPYTQLLYERQPQKVIQQTLELRLTQKSCLSKWCTPNLSPMVNTRSFGSLFKAPLGSAMTTSSASPISGGVARKGKRITPYPEIMLGVATRYHSHSHSLVAQREWIGSLVCGSPVHICPARVVGEWLGKPSIRLPLPLTRCNSYLLHTNREG